MRSHCRVGVHLVWATKNRRPWLVDELRPRVFEVLGGIAHRLHSSPIAIGGWVDHVHVYVMLSPQTTISALVNALKANSTAWVRRTHPGLIAFEWQRGYSAAGVDPRDDEALRRYIQDQETIHRSRVAGNPAATPNRNCVVVR